MKNIDGEQIFGMVEAGSLVPGAPGALPWRAALNRFNSYRGQLVLSLIQRDEGNSCLVAYTVVEARHYAMVE